MKIQLNTDFHAESTEALAVQINAKVNKALNHFGEHITRVEVHLSDENSGKSGHHDHRCMLEARLQGRQPVVVTDHAATTQQALNGATHKLARLLSKTLGRLQGHREKISIPPLPILERAQEEIDGQDPIYFAPWNVMPTQKQTNNLAKDHLMNSRLPEVDSVYIEFIRIRTLALARWENEGGTALVG